MPLEDRDVIFLFGLPRSGTTLIQRLLWQSPLVHTTAEPWVLLPWMQPLRHGGERTDYNATQAHQAVNDLPVSSGDVRRSIRAAALELYGRLMSDAPTATKFLDKTPRYHIISEEILRTFPESRAVLVWRNPLSVAASIMSTWNRGKWNIYNYRIDLYDGARSLLRAERKFSERIYTVRYENFVADPYGVAAGMFAHLGLTFNTDMISLSADARLEGRMGDKTGQRAYSEVSGASLDKYRKAFRSPLRSMWAHRYLDWLGDSALSQMGYDHDQTYGSIGGRLDVREVASDALRMAWGWTLTHCDPTGDDRSRRRQGLPSLRYR